MLFFVLFMHVMCNKLGVWNKSSFSHFIVQSCQFCIDVVYLIVIFVIHHKCVHLSINFNPSLSRYFLDTIHLHSFSDCLFIIPTSNNSINICQQHISRGILWIQFEYIVCSTLCSFNVIVPPTTTKQSHPCGCIRLFHSLNQFFCIIEMSSTTQSINHTSVMSNIRQDMILILHCFEVVKRFFHKTSMAACIEK